MKRNRRSVGSERGAMLAQAVIALLALIGITTFVVDYGVLWVGRNAAQNSADAGALAGATAMAFDNYTDRTVTGPAVQNALRIAKDNLVADQRPAVDPTTDITFPTCPDGSDGCIKVTVYRNQSHSNPLPTIFGNIVGLTKQGVLATATAEVMAGNASNCIKPWVVVDQWQENLAPVGFYNKYYNCGSGVCTYTGPVDKYVAPSPTDPGTGYNLTNNFGNTFVLKAGSPSSTVQPGFYYPVDLPLPPSGNYVTGGNQYRTNIASCTNYPVKIGDTLPPETGNMVGPTSQGITDLYDLDPSAYWNGTDVVNSCAPGCNPATGLSPRVIAIALVNPDTLAYSQVASGGKNLTLTITNIMGFFINAPPDKSGNVTGILMSYPGLTIGTPTIGPGAFLMHPVLVR